MTRQIAVESVYKLIILGDSGVGKTALIARYTLGIFDPEEVSSLSLDVSTKTVDWQGKKMKLKIWDTAGQERFASIAKSYCHGADAVIFCYDITRQHSFHNINKWLHDLSIPEDCFMVLVGCKSDLERERVVSLKEGQLKAENLGYLFFETSALMDNSNISDVFGCVISKLVDKEPKNIKKTFTVSVEPQDYQPSSKSTSNSRCAVIHRCKS